MEHLKACPTNAQAIGDIDVVYYQTVVVKPVELPSASTSSNHTPDRLQTLEASLRDAGYLVARDTGRGLLWLFECGDAEKTNNVKLDEPRKIAKAPGFELFAYSHGELKATELTRYPIRGFPQGTSTPRPPQVLNARSAVPAAHEQRPIDNMAIYEFFMSAIIGSLTYDLRNGTDLIPLNARTLISSGIQQDTDAPGPPSVLLVTLDTYWSSSGNLIVYWSFLRNGSVIPLSSFSPNEKHSAAELYLRVAPSGIIATISLGEILHQSNQSPIAANASRRKRTRRQGVDEKSVDWKSVVKSWLMSIGIRIPDLDVNENWVRVRLGRRRETNPGPSNASCHVLWPKALCFVYDHSTYSISSSSGFTDILERDENLESFLSPSMASPDCMETAQKWLTETAERNSSKAMLHPSRSTGKLPAPPQMDFTYAPGPSSPLYLRAGILGDMQPTGGVYPTPPDAIIHPSTAVSNTMEGPSNSAGIPSLDQMASNMMATPNFTSQSDPVPFNFAESSSNVPPITEKVDDHDMGNDADDLFEDFDEDGFTQNNVTDADFNFFDEPDEDDMIDAPEFTEPASKSEHVSPSLAVAIKTEVAEDSNTLISADPMAEDVEDCESFKAEPGQSTQEPVSAAGNDADDHNTSPEQRFVSPTAVRKTSQLCPQLGFASSSREVSELPRKESIFDPISFTDKLNLSDNKYSSGRFKFASLAKQDNWQHKVLTTRSILDNDKASGATPSTHASQAVKLALLSNLIVDDSDSASLRSIGDASTGDEDVQDDSNLEQIIAPIPKRKRAVDEQSTPISVLSPSEASHIGEADGPEESVAVSVDLAHLTRLEPSPWDWSLAGFPTPSATPTPSLGQFSATSQGAMNPPILKTEPDSKITQSPEDMPLTKRDIISIAQIFSEQVVTSCLEMMPSIEVRDVPSNGTLSQSPLSTELLVALRKTVKDRFPAATECHLSKYASLHDPIPEPPQTAKTQHRPNARRTTNAGGPEVTLFNIAPPHVRLRRAETLWDLLPPSLAFWEPLGLAPVSDSKNVMSFCILPSNDGFLESANVLLDNISLAYEGCKLGTHFRGHSMGDIQHGIMPCDISHRTSYEAAMAKYRKSFLELGETLGALDLDDEENKIIQQVDTFVIYVVNPFESRQALWDICAAFWGLFQQYGSGPDCPDIVLQVLPLRYIAPYEAPVILEPGLMAKLAREVYDRCPPTGPSGDRLPLHIFSGPAIHLEETLPRSVQFKISMEPHADPLRENSHMHVGYSISMDGSWITAAWTDNFGKYQACASYYLGSGRSFPEVAREIWQTTLDIISKRKVTWRICLVRAGVMAPEESDVWASLAMQSSTTHLCTALLSFDTNPSLAVFPSSSFVNFPSSSAANPQSTPVGTPQPGVSPDPHGLTPAATPSEMAQDLANDSDARLVDVTDETWGMILGHRLNNSNSVVDFRPSLSSGILIRGGSIDGQSPPSFSSETEPSTLGLHVMAVNLIFLGATNPTRNTGPPTPSSSPLTPQDASIGAGVAMGMGMPSTPGTPTATNTSGGGGLMFASSPSHRLTAELFLKDVMIQYRGLGLLAKLKGMRGTRAGMVPWHVAVCMRSVVALQKGAAF